MIAPRFVSTITALFVGLLLLVGTASAQPTPADLTAAKKAYVDGKAAYDKKNYETAVVKFKESYRLSKNPLLLYNIGLTYEDMGSSEDLALVNYRKFLKDAPADAAQRDDVAARVKNLEKTLNIAQPPQPPGPDTTKPPGPDTTTNPPGPDTTTNPPGPDTTKPPAPPHVDIKPSGTYAAKDFQHQVVVEAPPGKALDVTAFVPEDSGWTVTLYFRGAGDTKFYTKVMRWRYKELVARIPQAKVGGQSIQYYVEARDQGGQVVARSGKATSPNIVDMVSTAPPRFYPDWTDDTVGDTATPAQLKHHDEEDPLNKGGGGDTHDEVPGPGIGANQNPGGGDTGTGQVDDPARAKKMMYARWGTTIGAGVFLGLGVVGYIEAGSYATALKNDVTADCAGGAHPPCRQFDSYDQGLQSTGHTYQTIERIMLPLGVVTAGVAGYLWYREMKSRKAHGAPADSQQPAAAPKAPVHDELGLIIAPTATDTFVGAAALVTF